MKAKGHPNMQAINRVHTSQLQQVMAMDADKIKPMLYALADEERLSKWEMSFVESVTEQFGDKGSLSSKQYETLENIYRKFN